MALNATSQSTPYVTPLFFKENIRGTRMSLFIERMMTNDDVTPVCIKEELQFAGGKTSRSIVISQIKQKRVITQA
jgi:hypothetical protein